MKKYFLAFDFHNRYIDKFYYGIVSADRNTKSLKELAKQIIKDNYSDICPEEVTIKVTAFNNVEL